MKDFLQTNLRWVASLLALFTTFTFVQGQIIYVKQNSSGFGDGLNWTNAFNTLQQAIDAAGIGDTVFVAGGTYLPSFQHNGDSERHSTFYINKTIYLFGGFSGEPGTEGGFSERNMIAHPSILSGDLGQVDVLNDNAFHVLFLDRVSDSTGIDGFTITKGYGFGGSAFEALGAGIFNNADAGRSNPTFTNCIILENRTSESGGGMYNYAPNGGTASPTFLHCSFISNLGSGAGGLGIYADGEGTASPLLINCKFMGNSGPTAGGGAIQCIGHSSISSAKLINCIVSGNHSPSSSALATFVTGTGVSNIEITNCAFSGNTGGSIGLVDLAQGNSTLKIRNSIIWANGGSQSPTTTGGTIDAAFSIIPFGFPGEGVIGLDPMYVDQPPLLDTAHILGDLHLLPGSPAFDAGRNTDLPVGIITDLDQKPRFVNSTNGQPGIVDIGPYEFQGTTTNVSPNATPIEWNVFPNPAYGEVNISFPDATQTGLLHILDNQGRLIETHFVNSGDIQHRFDVTSIAPGAYYIYLSQGAQTAVKKIVVKRP